MTQDLNKIAEEFYTQNDRATIDKEDIKMGAQHIAEVLDGSSADADITAGDVDIDNVVAEGTLETDDATSTNEIQRFFKDKSSQERLHFLQKIIADPEFDNDKVHADLEGELKSAQKEVNDRKNAIGILLPEIDKDPLPAPKQLAENPKLAAIKDLLTYFCELNDLVNGAREPSQDEIIDALDELRKRERTKAGIQVLVKYLYKLAKKPGVKKYLSGLFGKIRQEEEPNLEEITDKNMADFRTIVGL